jgi:hypothetical protein
MEIDKMMQLPLDGWISASTTRKRVVDGRHEHAPMALMTAPGRRCASRDVDRAPRAGKIHRADGHDCSSMGRISFLSRPLIATGHHVNAIRAGHRCPALREPAAAFSTSAMTRSIS